jgi:tRNA A-37 threonylcarbamoyl transferase component Bud32
MPLTVGSVLAGRYEIVAPIATGGMGEVWRARDQVLNRIVAAKVLRSEYTGDPNFLARFRNEARHTAALSHPNIASVYDYGETTDALGQNLAFLVMEFVDGQPLVSILHEEGRLPVDWTLHVLDQAADGLSAAHRAGVVHRDIKPGNLMVRADGMVKLTDFGIAQARDATPLTRTGMVVGTAQYLSPEQAQGMEVTAASDVYSLGVVAYECLAGARPFDGASQVAIALAHINRPPPPLPREIPPAVRLLVERALAKDPADRFPDGGAFAEAVRRVAAGGTLAAPAPVPAPATAPTSVMTGADGRTEVFASTGAATGVGGYPATGAGGPMPPLQRPPADDALATEEPLPDDGGRRRRLLLWLAAGLVLLLLVGAGLFFLLGNNGPDGGTARATTSTSPSSSTSASAGVLLDASYLGRNGDEVQQELERRGLEVTQQRASQAQMQAAGMPLAAGDVAALDPFGTTVQPGTDVTLFYAPEAYPPATSAAPEPSSAAPTTAQTTAPTTPPATSEATTPATTSSAVTSTTATTLPGSSAASSSPAEPGGDVGGANPGGPP